MHNKSPKQIFPKIAYSYCFFPINPHCILNNKQHTNEELVVLSRCCYCVPQKERTYLPRDRERKKKKELI